MTLEIYAKTVEPLARRQAVYSTWTNGIYPAVLYRRGSRGSGE